MLKKIKEILNNQWVVNICAPLIVAGITTFGVSMTQKVNLRESLIIIFNFIKDILNCKIPLWSILLFLLFVLVVRVLIISLKSKNSISREHPDWYYDFKTMKYKNWIFTWNYEEYGGEYTIENIRPICSCGCELTDLNGFQYRNFMGSILKCPNCEKTYGSPPMEVMGSLGQLIKYKVDTNNYFNESIKD